MTKRKTARSEGWTPATPEEARVAFDTLQTLLDDAKGFRLCLDELEKGMLEASKADSPKKPKPSPKRRTKR